MRLDCDIGKKNNKYFTIGVYAVCTFAACAIVAKIIFSFSAVTKAISVVVGVLVPFIAGVILAYLINPIYKLFDFKIFSRCFKKESQRGLRRALSLMRMRQKEI